MSSVLSALAQQTSRTSGTVLPDNAILYPPPICLQQPSESPFFDEVELCEYMKSEIFPQLAPPPYGEIQVRKLSHQKAVYLFLEKTRAIAAVGKVFRHDTITLDQAWLSAEREYFNLNLLRNRFGMYNDSWHVVEPLGKNKELSALLVTAKARGKVLDYYIAQAIYEHAHQRLFDKLGSLAMFFVKLHRNTEREKPVSPALPQSYLNKLLDSLGMGPLNPAERESLETFAAKWWNEDDIFTDSEVIVHGDATTTNFLCYHNEVTGIDLEKMKWADRCWDLGFIAAELKHHFMWRMGDGWAAEPFIGHFLWQYSVNYGDSRVFHDLTRRIPLYMALGLLRIARNAWLDEPHRKNLLNEAKRCLEYGLSSSTTIIPS